MLCVPLLVGRQAGYPAEWWLGAGRQAGYPAEWWWGAGVVKSRLILPFWYRLTIVIIIGWFVPLVLLLFIVIVYCVHTSSYSRDF